MLGYLKAYLVFPLAERRLHRDILGKLSVLEAESRHDFAARKRLAMERLVGVLRLSGSMVPYYRDLFARLNFDPDKVARDIRYFEDLPWLTKEMVMEQGPRMLSEAVQGRNLHERKTGSSTGPSAIIFYDQEALDWTAAENILAMAWGGKKRHQREVHLSTQFLEPLSPEAIRHENIKCFILNRTNIYTGSFTPEALATVIQQLLKASARSVQGHPSTLFALARYARDEHIDVRNCFDIFMSTGEMLYNHQRKLIEEVFACRVVSRYGAAEFGVMAQELFNGAFGDMRVVDSLVYPEVADVDENGVGELVFTGLRNDAMPLIRYRMGDRGQLEERSSGWWIPSIHGRTHDLVTVDGTVYPTHFIQDILDRCGHIHDFQIVTRAGIAKEFRLVVNAADEVPIAEQVRKNFPTVPVKFISKAELVLSGWRDKFRYVIEETTGSP